MPNQGLNLELTDATLRSLNLKVVRVTYSKRVIVPSVWPPSGLFPLVSPSHEFGLVSVYRYILVRPDEIPEIEAQVDSLEKDVPLPSHSILKIERHGDKSYLFLETSAELAKDTKRTPARFSLTTRALEILKKIPWVSAICGYSIGNRH